MLVTLANFCLSTIPWLVIALGGVAIWAWRTRREIRLVNVLVVAAIAAVLCVFAYRAIVNEVRRRQPEIGHARQAVPEDHVPDAEEPPSEEIRK